jgi:hypothetical protein
VAHALLICEVRTKHPDRAFAKDDWYGGVADIALTSQAAASPEEQT